jgi:hypothetical protein
MSADADAGRPGEDAGAEGDSRKQHQEEKKQNKKNISSGNDFAVPPGENLGIELERSGELGRTIFSPSRLLPVALPCELQAGRRGEFSSNRCF